MDTFITSVFNPMEKSGKTHTALHLARCSEEMGKRVLLVDLAPNANLSRDLLDPSMFMKLYQKSMVECVTSHSQLFNACPISSSRTSGSIYLMPYTKILEDYESILDPVWDSHTALSYSLQSSMKGHLLALSRVLDISEIVIDMGSSISHLNRAMLMNSDQFLIPMKDYSPSNVSHYENTMKTISGWMEDRRALNKSIDNLITKNSPLYKKDDPQFRGMFFPFAHESTK